MNAGIHNTGVEVFTYVGFEVLCCACGIGAATISFTAWCIILPFLFTVMNFPLFKALFLSVLSDLTSCAFLTILYAFKRKVIYSTWVFGVLQVPVAVGVSLYLGGYLEKYQEFLKKNLNILMLMMAVFYFGRFIVSCVKELKERRKKKKKKEAKTLRREARKMRKNNRVNTMTTINAEPGELEDSPFSELPPISLEEGEEVEGENGFHDELSSTTSEESDDDAPVTMVLASRKNPLEFFTVEEGAGIFNNNYSTKGAIFRHVLFVGWAMTTATISGFFKNGGGLQMNILLQFVYKQNQVVSTATGCFLSLLLCGAVAGTFVTMPELFDNEMLVYSGLCVTCSLIGCIMGSSIILLLSDMYIFLLIGFICLGLGIIPMIIHYLPHVE